MYRIDQYEISSVRKGNNVLSNKMPFKRYGIDHDRHSIDLNWPLYSNAIHFFFVSVEIICSKKMVFSFKTTKKHWSMNHSAQQKIKSWMVFISEKYTFAPLSTVHAHVENQKLQKCPIYKLCCAVLMTAIKCNTWLCSTQCFVISLSFSLSIDLLKTKSLCQIFERLSLNQQKSANNKHNNYCVYLFSSYTRIYCIHKSKIPHSVLIRIRLLITFD